MVSSWVAEPWVAAEERVAVERCGGISVILGEEESRGLIDF